MPSEGLSGTMFQRFSSNKWYVHNMGLSLFSFAIFCLMYRMLTLGICKLQQDAMQAMRRQNQACTEQETNYGMLLTVCHDCGGRPSIACPDLIFLSLVDACVHIILKIPVFQVKNMRKEIADLLRTSKQENARIRVETVIRENLLLQAFETLELFMELLAVRAQLVEKSKDMPPDMIEALSSLVYSAQRLQVFSAVHTAKASLRSHSLLPTYAAAISPHALSAMLSFRRRACPTHIM